MTTIDGDRLLRDLRELAGFGKVGTGVNRTAFMPVEMEARRWLCGKMKSAGLEAGLDSVGNVLGRDETKSRAVLIGSHSDTVPNGGWLDGALGVVYGLEIARTLRGTLPVGVDVVSFQDEEGTFVPCLGSKSFCEILDRDEASRAVALDGRRLADELANAKLPARHFNLDRSRHIAFLEAHIEQGPRLEAAGNTIGVVTGIVGIRRYRITATGQGDHAGTTPMSMRKDAGAALIRIAAALIENMPRFAGRQSVWNIGRIDFLPGAANVVPAKATLFLEFRDPDHGQLMRIDEQVHRMVATAAADSPLPIAIEAMGGVDPIAMDARLQKYLLEAAKARGDSPLAMPSGAGHDAMVLAPLLPSAMMFIPSIGGRSHDLTENTADADIVFGCQVMADAAARLCREDRPG